MNRLLERIAPEKLALLALGGLYLFGGIAVWAAATGNPRLFWRESSFALRHAEAFLIGLLLIRFADSWAWFLAECRLWGAALALLLLIIPRLPETISIEIARPGPWPILLALPSICAGLFLWQERRLGKGGCLLVLGYLYTLTALMPDLPSRALFLIVTAGAIVTTAPPGGRLRIALPVFLPIVCWMTFEIATGGYLRFALVRSWRAFAYRSDPQWYGFQTALAMKDLRDGGYFGAGIKYLAHGFIPHRQFLSRFLLQTVARQWGLLGLSWVAACVAAIGVGCLRLSKNIPNDLLRNISQTLLIFVLAQMALSAARVLNLGPFLPSLQFPVLGHGWPATTAAMGAVGFILWAGGVRLVSPLHNTERCLVALLQDAVARIRLVSRPDECDLWFVLGPRSSALKIFRRGRCRFRLWRRIGEDAVWRDVRQVLHVSQKQAYSMVASGDGRAGDVARARLTEMLSALADEARSRLRPFRISRTHVVIPAALKSLPEIEDSCAKALAIARQRLYIRWRRCASECPRRSLL